VRGIPDHLSKLGLWNKNSRNFDVLVHFTSNMLTGTASAIGRLGQQNSFVKVGVQKTWDKINYGHSLKSYSEMARMIVQNMGKLMGLGQSDCKIGVNANAISDMMSSPPYRGTLLETGWSVCTRLMFDLSAKSYFTTKNFFVNDNKKVDLWKSPYEYAGSDLTLNDQCNLIDTDTSPNHYR